MLVANHSLDKITLTDPLFDWGIIWLLFISFYLLGTRVKSSNSNIESSSHQIKGIAVWLLLVGHLSIHLLARQTWLSQGGYWAVIIFLFLSGFGLAKKYDNASSIKQFWWKRFSKMYPLLWISIGIMIVLEGLFYQNTFHLIELTLAFIGWMKPDAFYGLNGAGWYIGFQLIWYGIFSLMYRRRPIPAFLAMIFVSIVMVGIIWYVPFGKYIGIWSRYVFIFPLGFLVGKFSEQVKQLVQGHAQRWIMLLVLILSTTLFVFQSLILKFSQLMLPITNPAGIVFLYNTFIGIALVPLILYVLNYFEESRFENKWLLLLGRYSYPIYLVHLPIMTKYDMLLSNKPLGLYWWIYLSAVFAIVWIMVDLVKRLRFDKY